MGSAVRHAVELDTSVRRIELGLRRCLLSDVQTASTPCGCEWPCHTVDSTAFCLRVRDRTGRPDYANGRAREMRWVTGDARPSAGFSLIPRGARDLSSEL